MVTGMVTVTGLVKIRGEFHPAFTNTLPRFFVLVFCKMVGA